MPEDGQLVRRWIKSSYDPETQLEHTEDRYELVREGVVVRSEFYTRSPATRNYSLSHITEMMQDTGFTDALAVTEFSDIPASPNDRLFCVFGTRL